MRSRSLLPDVAGVILLAWAGLLGYVSVPTLLTDDPLWDGGVSVLGAVLAAAHVIAALGLFGRRGWGRRLGLIIGLIGLFGTAIVLLTLAANVGRVSGFLPDLSPLVLGIPAGMVAAYALIVGLLWRAGPEFERSAR
jgi:FtsH-binding integral membrane protein